MKFIDLFAGIGGFRLGLERAGHECVAFCEIDKFARESYKAIHDTEGEEEYHDITEVTNDQWREHRGTVDLISGGFPCQSFSIAGKRKGFEDTRGTMFFEIARAAKEIQPSFLLLENVKGLLNHDKGRTFTTIIQTLDELGYDAEWEVLNSKNFGVPQNRERVFIIGHLRGAGGRKVFPFGRENESTTENVVKQLNDNKNIKGFESVNRFYDVDGVSPTLNTMSGGGREPKVAVKEATKKGYTEAEVGDSINFSHPNSKTRRGRVGKKIANTLTTGEEQSVLTDNYRIRKLTPKECWRLQGFPDSAFEKAQAVNSNSQLYKQAGNSVTVNVIHEIAKRIGVQGYDDTRRNSI